MPWFKVDDSIHSHPKRRRAGLAAIGLWVVSGSYSASYLTDGFVSQSFVRQQGPNATRLASRLVAAGLWYVDQRNGETGWSFHDWEQYQPTKAQVERDREQAKTRMQLRRSSPEHPPNFERSSATPSRPDPLVVGSGNQPHQRNHSPPGAASAKSARAGPTKTDLWQAIANCDLCDDDGRKPNGMVCDHIDRRFTAAHGTKQVYEQMGWNK
jgi:hypothetical protein